VLAHEESQAEGADRRTAIALFVAAGLVFSALDSYVKVMLVTIPVVVAMWSRGVVFLLLLAISGRHRPRRLLRSSSPRLQAARAVALFVAALTFFSSLALLPLGETVALAQVSPLIVVALAGPLLHERVATTAIMGTVIGFVGVAILVGLDPRGISAWSLLPLASSASFAAFSLLSRAVRHDAEEVTLFYAGTIGLLLATGMLVAFWPGDTVEPTQWLLAGLVGVLSLAGHRLLISAYRRGEASDLAPFGYLELAWAFLAGAVLFGEPIELTSVVGASAIVMGGLIAIRGVLDDAPEAVLAAQPGRDGATDEELVDDCPAAGVEADPTPTG
jgi:drug/metabolite transporter (DMT)-like permease